MDLEISARKSGSVTILDARGPITFGASDDVIKAEVRKLAESRPCNILLNLAHVTKMDSSGLSALVQTYVTLKRDGGGLKLANPTGEVRDLLEVTGLAKFIPTYANETEALASFLGTSAHA